MMMTEYIPWKRASWWRSTRSRCRGSLERYRSAWPDPQPSVPEPWPSERAPRPGTRQSRRPPPGWRCEYRPRCGRFRPRFRHRKGHGTAWRSCRRSARPCTRERSPNAEWKTSGKAGLTFARRTGEVAKKTRNFLWLPVSEIPSFSSVRGGTPFGHPRLLRHRFSPSAIRPQPLPRSISSVDASYTACQHTSKN